MKKNIGSNQFPSLTALVVDDLPSMRWIVVRRLKELGFTSIIEAKDADMGIKRLCFAAQKGIEISLIVSDLHMPNVDGIEFIKLVREYPEFKNIPVVMLGNFSEFDSEEIGRHIEDIICVLKPINAEDFIHKVKAAMYKAGVAS